jgi:hypothetical protein
MNVEILNAFDPNKYRYYNRVPTPKLCSVFLTADLLNSVERAKRVVDENNLVEVALNVCDVDWFAWYCQVTGIG